MISRELFISVLECVESQYRKDVGYGDRLREVFGFSDNVLYDNSDLVKSVLDLLRVYFPVDDKGFCEIEHWMFFLDFGKCGDDYESPGQLYDRLVLVWQNDILRKGYEVGILYPKPKNDRNF